MRAQGGVWFGWSARSSVDQGPLAVERKPDFNVIGLDGQTGHPLSLSFLLSLTFDTAAKMCVSVYVVHIMKRMCVCMNVWKTERECVFNGVFFW